MRARPHLVEGRPSRRGYWQDVVSRSLVTASSLLQLEATNHFFLSLSLSPTLPSLPSFVRACTYIRTRLCLCSWQMSQRTVPKRILPRQCNTLTRPYLCAPMCSHRTMGNGRFRGRIVARFLSYFRIVLCRKVWE